MPIAKYFIGCIAIIALLVSCKKDEPFDKTGDPVVKFFTDGEALGNAPQNSISYSVVNIPDVAGSGVVNLSTTVPATIKFPVLSTRPVAGDVTIGAVLDNSLIASYNAANNTNYLPFPDGVLNTDALSAKILKGQTISADSITITPYAANFNILTEKKYMAPIKLTTVSNPEAGEITKTTTQVLYIVVDAEQRRIRYNATAAQALGTLISPRTAWTAAFNPAPATFGGNGSIFDGSTSTYSRWASGTSPATVDVDMQSVQNVTGIRLYTSNSTTTTPTQIEVYLSSDGITWDHIGTPLRANLTFASGYNYILFYKAIPAKYVRLVMSYSTSTSSQNLRVTEFDVYAN